MSNSISNTAVPFADVFHPFAQMGEVITSAIFDAIGTIAETRKTAKANRLRRETETALRSLSNATLKDIGVPRGQITEIADRMAQESVYGGRAGN